MWSFNNVSKYESFTLTPTTLGVKLAETSTARRAIEAEEEEEESEGGRNVQALPTGERDSTRTMESLDTETFAPGNE